MHEKIGDPANPPEQDRSQSCREGTAPEKWVCDMDISIRTLMSQGGAGDAFFCKFPVSSSGFISIREVTDQNANTHYVSFSHCAV